MKKTIISNYGSTLETARQLVDDVACDRLAEQPYDGAKHPAWVLGHLSLASGMVVGYLTGEPGGLGGVPESWAEACMPGKACTKDRSAYAEKDELIRELERVHGKLADAFADASDGLLDQEFPDPEYRSFFPTLRDAAVYVMAHHEGYHLGQLSQWRRAAGFPPVS